METRVSAGTDPLPETTTGRQSRGVSTQVIVGIPGKIGQAVRTSHIASRDDPCGSLAESLKDCLEMHNDRIEDCSHCALTLMECVKNVI
ncbi:unnamed protein product [Cuscuta campestris]|uniref:CHCH domain-containing protein n=1 Tax=Cuscuta campestris TaxID=132261 RepID=A0A484KZW9_9ASTE|nr:unnamed protein product [Cuscuta campestris]